MDILEAFGFGTLLLIPALYFWFLGIATRFISGNRLWFTDRQAPAFVHEMLIGQSVAFLLIYVRSFLNHLLGFVLPITTADFIILGLALGLLLYWRGLFSSLSVHIKSNIRPYMLLLGCVFVVLSCFSYLELPRNIMLSSDPDHHAFWANQIARFKTIPFDQGFWGKRPFDYPAGFAVLNYLWMILSGFDCRNIVSVQPLVQTFLAILLLFESVWRRPIEKLWQYAAGLLLVFLLYFLFLPYGYQSGCYHLEGTGRMSSLFFLAVGFSYLCHQSFRVKACFIGFNSIWFIAFLVISMLMNPINVFMGLGLFCLWGLMQLDVKALLKCMVGLPVLVMLFLDPYYYNSLLARGVSATNHAGLINHELWGQWLRSDWVTILSTALSIEVLNPLGTIYLIVLLGSLCLGYLYISRKEVTERKCVILSIPILLMMLLVNVLLRPYFDAIAGHSLMHRLLSPYLVASGHQMLYLWIFFVIISGFAFASQFKRWKPIWVFVLLLIVPLNLISNSYRDGRVRLRKNYVGPMGTVTADDLTVISKIERLFKEYQEKKPLTYDEVPKILIPNEVMPGIEDWIFPHGASRILPYYNVFPVAFYYYQGNPEFSYQNYKRRIIESFDLKWLREHKVQYLFMPSDIGKGTMHPLYKKAIEGRIVFQSNKTAFYRLFD